MGEIADVRLPKYREGQRVVAAAALFNDGSHPEREADALLVEAGSTGEVVQVGHYSGSRFQDTGLRCALS